MFPHADIKDAFQVAAPADEMDLAWGRCLGADTMNSYVDAAAFI
jgi:hypothetical protein